MAERRARHLFYAPPASPPVPSIVISLNGHVARGGNGAVADVARPPTTA